MRVDGAGVNNQSLIEFRTREVLRFCFGLEFSGCSRASPSRQQTSFLHLKGHIPSVRHLSPKDDAREISLTPVVLVRYISLIRTGRAHDRIGSRIRSCVAAQRRGQRSFRERTSSKLDRDSIRSAALHKPRRQRRRRQQLQRLPQRHDVLLRHGKHRHDTHRRDGRRRDSRHGQHRRAHHDMRRHHWKLWRRRRCRR